jgi:cytochrome c553
LFLVVSALIADSGGVAADGEAGKNKAGTCAACHGENGISQTENTPSLAAQPDQFLQWQLVFFRSGARKNEIMAPVAEQLSNEEAVALGRCASCHGDSFAGSKAVARIAGQHEEYVVKSLHDCKAGRRTGGGVAAMAEVAYPLSEDDISALCSLRFSALSSVKCRSWESRAPEAAKEEEENEMRRKRWIEGGY